MRGAGGLSGARLKGNEKIPLNGHCGQALTRVHCTLRAVTAGTGSAPIGLTVPKRARYDVGHRHTVGLALAQRETAARRFAVNHQGDAGTDARAADN